MSSANLAASSQLYEDGPYLQTKKKPTNPLLVRPEVGKVKQPTRSLPPSDHTYGRRDQYDAEGAREVTSSWSDRSCLVPPSPPKDFVKLNRTAALVGCTTATHQKQFRQTLDVRVQRPPGKDTSKPNLEGRVFGLASRPSTPIAGVLSNEYQRQAIAERKQKQQMEDDIEAHRASIAKQKKIAATRPLPTRATVSASELSSVPAPEPLKLARFRDVPSRVSAPKGTVFACTTRARPVLLPALSPSPSQTLLSPSNSKSSPTASSQQLQQHHADV